MSRYLAESTIEDAAIEWLTAINGYSYSHGADIHRPLTKVVLEDRLEQFLQKRYSHVPAKVLAEVKQEFLYNKGTDLQYRNHEFHKKLSKGISKSWKQPTPSPPDASTGTFGSQEGKPGAITPTEQKQFAQGKDTSPLKGGGRNDADEMITKGGVRPTPSPSDASIGPFGSQEGKMQFEHFYPVDYDNWQNNDFLVVNQFSIEGRNKRRPDLLIFINGLPLVLFEFKNMFDAEATVENAFNQVQHYIEDIPALFEYNALTIISDGATTLHGMYSSGFEWFAAWKSTDGINTVSNDFALDTLINGLLLPQRLLQYIRFYIFHEPDKGKLIKKGAKYHQFFGIQFALEQTKASIRPVGDGKIGVIWHTTRSGKSITMAIYTGILRQLPELKNPTIVVQVDRFDLNKQLYEDFVAAKDLVGDVQLATSADELRKLLSADGGGVIFSTIEKFRLKTLPTSNSSQEGDTSPLKGGERNDAVETIIKGGVKKLLSEGTTSINLNAFAKSGILKYNPKLKQTAHDLRYAENHSEVLLWNELKRDALGVDFHRQKPIDSFVVDFFCSELMLAIEIDGKIHDDEKAAAYDAERQQKLEACGIVFLRFDAKDVFQNIGWVVEEIQNYVAANKLPAKLSQLERAVYNYEKEFFISLLGDTPYGKLTGDGQSTSPLKGGSDTPHHDSTRDELSTAPLQGGSDISYKGVREDVHPTLSLRENIIVIADECHRTQYGLLQGFARNLRNALPNASFIGFTGTPVDSKDADTEAVFGEIIHRYDIKQATEDKAVVPIYYEPRLAKLHLANTNIEEEAEEITEGLTDNQKNKVLWAAAEDAAGAAERVEEVATDILKHYLQRISTLEGKAMIVCMSRRNCVKMYDAITALEACPEVAVIMTTNIAKDPVAWKPHVRTKEAMEAVKARFKDPDDPLKIVIVRDMWLTGFDNPALHTMYVDKIMNGHNLIQAINRVSTVFRDKPSGLIVDYIGIGDNLSAATKKYTGSGGSGDVTIPVQEAFDMAKDEIGALKALLPAGTDYSRWMSMSNGDQLRLISTVVNSIVAEEERSKDFLLFEKRLSGLAPIIKSHDEIEEITLDIIFFQHVGAAVRKIKYPVTNIRQKEGQIKELIHRSIESEAVVDVFAMAGIPKFDISIINDDFLAAAKEKKSGNELKLELIRQIINNEIKVRANSNLIKYRKLKESVEKIIHDYHNHFFDSLVALQKLREVAGDMQEEDNRRKQLGFTEEEEAFYEILAKHKTAISDFSLIQGLVKEITANIKKNLQIDWYKKPDAKAQILLAVKRSLLKKGVSQELKDILDEIMEQAEARYKEWFGEEEVA